MELLTLKNNQLTKNRNMYIYLYDSFLDHKKYNKTIAKIETRITDLGLNGKIVRLNPLNSISTVLNSEIKFGAKTIIGLGNNNSLNNIINAVSNLKLQYTNNSITIGFIPIGNNNSLANYLGINSISTACDIISNRRIKEIGLGVVNKINYFFTEAVISNKNSIIEINEIYTLETKDKGSTKIINTSLDPIFSKTNKHNKNKLKLLINEQKNNLFKKEKNKNSFINFNKLRIINDKEPLVLDSCVSIKNPTDINMSDKKIKLIVGKNRNF